MSDPRAFLMHHKRKDKGERKTGSQQSKGAAAPSSEHYDVVPIRIGLHEPSDGTLSEMLAKRPSIPLLFLVTALEPSDEKIEIWKRNSAAFLEKYSATVASGAAVRSRVIYVKDFLAASVQVERQHAAASTAAAASTPMAMTQSTTMMLMKAVNLETEVVQEAKRLESKAIEEIQQIEGMCQRFRDYCTQHVEDINHRSVLSVSKIRKFCSDDERDRLAKLDGLKILELYECLKQEALACIIFTYKTGAKLELAAETFDLMRHFFKKPVLDRILLSPALGNTPKPSRVAAHPVAIAHVASLERQASSLPSYLSQSGASAKESERPTSVKSSEDDGVGVQEAYEAFSEALRRRHDSADSAVRRVPARHASPDPMLNRAPLQANSAPPPGGRGAPPIRSHQKDDSVDSGIAGTPEKTPSPFSKPYK